MFTVCLRGCIVHVHIHTPINTFPSSSIIYVTHHWYTIEQLWRAAVFNQPNLMHHFRPNAKQYRISNSQLVYTLTTTIESYLFFNYSSQQIHVYEYNLIMGAEKGGEERGGERKEARRSVMDKIPIYPIYATSQTTFTRN